MRKNRDYEKEYQTYHKKHLKDKNSRNRARYAAEKAGKVRVGDGKEIDHKDNNPLNNSASNTRIISRNTNRGRKRRKI
jgi:hypothetical protein